MARPLIRDREEKSLSVIALGALDPNRGLGPGG